MKKIISIAFLIIPVLFSGCETEPEEYDCFPQRVKQTIAQGTDATSITADYKYEGGQLDHIIRSDYQTHYFDYNSDGTIVKLSRINVQKFEKLESRMIYESGMLSRSDEYRMRLDRFTQEDLDTTLTGYREFGHSGANIITETVYSLDDSTVNMELSLYKLYDYDNMGNLVKYVCFDDVNGDTVEAFSYQYDSKLNPFSSLSLPFEGETFVNNILESTDLITGDVYFHQILYASNNFPEQINIKQESYLAEVITIDYLCE